MAAISVMLLSLRMKDGENWWLRVCLRGAVVFGLTALARIDAAAVVLGAIMVLCAFAAARLYSRDLEKQKKQARLQMQKTAAAPSGAAAAAFIQRSFFSFQSISLQPAS